MKKKNAMRSSFPSDDTGLTGIFVIIALMKKSAPLPSL
jgi:hypothetical protein